MLRRSDGAMRSQWSAGIERATSILSRGLALFFGCFVLASLALAAGGAGDVTTWLLDLRELAAPLRYLVLAAGALVIVAHGAGFRTRWLPRIVAGVSLLALLAAVDDALAVWRDAGRGSVTLGAPPLSLATATALALVIAGRRASVRPTWRSHAAAILVAGAASPAFPWLQIETFGASRYEREADAIVVPGARAYADGTPSRALAERLETACRLYREGYASTLVLSGGPGDGAWHEAEVMRRWAIAHGVPDRDIVVDLDGLSTAATASRTDALLRQRRASRVLVVSQSTHLPRLKLAYQLHGREVWTVPTDAGRLPEHGLQVVRETAAWWWYFFGAPV